jgi:hypothetical protein
VSENWTLTPIVDTEPVQSSFIIQRLPAGTILAIRQVLTGVLSWFLDMMKPGTNSFTLFLNVTACLEAV